MTMKEIFKKIKSRLYSIHVAHHNRRFFKQHNRERKESKPFRNVCFAVMQYFLKKEEDNLDKLRDTCIISTFDDGTPYMSWASEEYKRYYNEKVVGKAMDFLERWSVEKFELKDKTLFIHTGCPYFVKPSLEMKAFIENETGYKLVIINKNTKIWHIIHELEYARCANTIDELL